MSTTITPAPLPSVLDGLAARRDEYKANADRIAGQLGTGPSMDELTRAEEEFLARLADVRRRKTDLAVKESEHRAAVEAAEFFDGLIDRTRTRIEQARQGPGVLVDRPRPYPDPLAVPPEPVSGSSAVTGGYPVAPAVDLPNGVEPLASGGFQIVPPSPSTPPDATPVVPSDQVVAMSGPSLTQPHPEAQPAQRGRHKKGRR